MVEKIKKLVTEVTHEQKEIEWSEVQSERIKMLQLSDWTQLDDVMLQPNHKREWRLWRDKVRNINRTTIFNAQIARDALNVLEDAKPTYTKVDQSLLDQRDNDVPAVTPPTINSQNEITRVEKVIVKEQPIILNQKLPAADLERMLNEFIQKNPERFQDMLRTIMLVDTNVVIHPMDTLEGSRQKVQDYLKVKQKEILERKLSTSSNKEILTEKTEQALAFLTTSIPDLEDFPLIVLYSDVNQITYREAAEAFLIERRDYNRILFEAERFLLYNKHRLVNAESLDDVKEILTDIRNGY